MKSLSTSRAKNSKNQPQLVLSNLADIVPQDFIKEYNNYSNEELEDLIAKLKITNSNKVFIKNQYELQNDEYSHNLKHQTKCSSFLTSDISAIRANYKAITSKSYEDRINTENERLKTEIQDSLNKSVTTFSNSLQIAQKLGESSIVEMRKNKMSTALQNQKLIEPFRALDSSSKFNISALLERQEYYNRLIALNAERNFELKKIIQENQELKIKLKLKNQENEKYTLAKKEYNETLQKYQKFENLKDENQELENRIAEYESKNTILSQKRDSETITSLLQMTHSAQTQWASLHIETDQSATIEELKRERDRYKRIFNEKKLILKEAQLKIAKALGIIYDCYDAIQSKRNDIN